MPRVIHGIDPRISKIIPHRRPGYGILRSLANVLIAACFVTTRGGSSSPAMSGQMV
jgi:hypothetical protein